MGFIEHLLFLDFLQLFLVLLFAFGLQCRIVFATHLKLCTLHTYLFTPIVILIQNLQSQVNRFHLQEKEEFV